MKTTPLAVILIVLASFPHHLLAGTIYESAALGPTSVDATDVLAGNPDGNLIGGRLIIGTRFFLPATSQIDQVGGHLIGFGPGGTAEGERGSIYAAIVALSGADDLPDSTNLSTPDLVATTLVDLPTQSADVYGDMGVTVASGWYALLFGGGQFGSDRERGVGAAVLNNAPIGNLSYLVTFHGDRINGDWITNSTFASKVRFVVTGTAVPEPSTGMLLFACGVCCHLSRVFRVRR